MRNRSLLENRGFYYPKTGIRSYAHHDFAERISRQHLRKANSEFLCENRQLQENMQEEIHAHSGSSIISSEAFQNCEPEIVRRTLDPFDVKVVVYLRDQASYLASAYAQKVHARKYTASMEEFYLSAFRADYFKFLSKWEKCFPDAITVRIFDRAILLKNDVIFDFAVGVLGLNAEEVDQFYVDDEANLTITSRLLAYKLHVNRTKKLTKHHRRKLYHGLARLALEDDSPKVAATNELVQKSLAQYADSNRKTARKYFDTDTLFRKKENRYGTPFKITQKEIELISKKLIDAHPELVDLLTLRQD